MGGSSKRTCAWLPFTSAPSKIAAVGRRTANFAEELTTAGSWKLEATRSCSIGC